VELPAESRFCLYCGAGLVPDGEVAYTPAHLERDVLVFRDAEEGERKEVTVLLADVAGSLAMSEKLDPEDVHALMNGFFALAIEAVHAERGTVNQFRGDGFMALFGAPRARGDDPARALRAALAVRERSREYAQSVRARFGVPFTVRIGVSTGLVWVGAIGNELRRDYTAEGPTVGLAARLEALAAPSQILISEETARRASGFALADLGPRPVRGLRDPVRVFELLGEQPAETKLAAREAGLSSFVGRAAELARLRRALVRDAAVRCVEVVGEAGIGKSRLVQEALRAPPAGEVVLAVGCRESSARRAYVPWLELLRGWPECLPGAEGAAALALALEGRGASPGDPAEVARSVRALLGELLAARGAVVVLDDAHWLDPSSRQLVRQLVSDPPAGSLTWIATLRDDQAGDWGAAGAVERIGLAALPAQDARRLAEAAASGLEPGLYELACLRGGGNPLFVEEVTRALRDGSEELRDAARLELSLARARERVPDTLRGVVAARVDALPEDAKRVLEMAAVVGECFDAELVRDVLSGLPDDPPAQLELLVARGLLRRAANGEYDFCHGVVRAGAEAQLVRERLASLHRRIADALAKRPLAATAAGASRIGSHYDRAGEPLAAIPQLLRAGQAYASLRALLEAVAHMRRAFELVRALRVPPPEHETAVGLALASALAALDRTGEAAAVLESLDLERAGEDDRLRVATVHVQAGWLRFSNDNDVERGRALLERGLRAAERLPGGGDMQLLALSYLTRLDTLDGELARALDSARRLGELAGARGDRTTLTLARYNECLVLCEAGRVSEARAAAEDASALVSDSDNELVAAMAHGAVARVQYFEGDASATLAGAARVEALARRSGQVGFLSHALAVRGYAHLLQGDARAAREAFETLGAIDARWPSTLLHRARGALETGDLREAAELARRALDAPRGVRARALAVLGLALGLAGGPRAEAERLLAEAIELCDRLGLRPWLAEALGFQAELAARSGDAAAAAHYRKRASELYARCAMHGHAAQLAQPS
jgi:class 3 adenylate cyclase/tetratricopeptide (TPR) repeat protein